MYAAKKKKKKNPFSPPLDLSSAQHKGIFYSVILPDQSSAKLAVRWHSDGMNMRLQ